MFYVGQTVCLRKRIREHKEGFGCFFTKRYRVNRLVYFERHSCRKDALVRERVLKKCRRVYKARLIHEKKSRMEGFMDEIN